MHQLTSRGWFSRLAPATALGFAFLFALGSQLHAQATLIVSYYGYTPHTNGMGGINFYATNPPYTAGAQVGTTLAQGTFPQLEASSCLAGPTPKLFTSSNSNTISTYNLNSALNGVTGTATTFVNSLFSVAGLSIGPNGLLYAADGVGIYAFAITTGKQVASFPLSGAHDVVYAPLARGGLGIVFATSSYNSATVYALDPISLARLGSGYDITLPPGPTFAQEGLAVDPGGNLFISNFQTIDHTQPGVYMYPGALNTSTPIEFFSDLFHHPLGLAAGPGDGKIYVANFGNLTNADLGGVLQIDPLNPLNPPVPLALTMSPMLANPKYVQFTENCTQPAPNGTIEICKLSSPLNPVPPGGVYNFNVMGVAATVTVPLGECSGPIYVPPPSAVITELPTPGTAVYTITTDGYSPPPFSQQQGNALLESSNTQTGMATVIVQGGLETIVTYTNYEAPNAQLKVCKIAGDTGTEGKSFTFTVTPPVGAAPFTVEAGPMGEGGYCTVVPSTFQVGTFATVTETLPVMPLIYSQPTVTVNGVPTKPRCSGVTSVTCSVAAAIGAGTNEVDFTNQLASSMPGPGCPPSCFGTPTTTLLTASDPAPVLGSPVTFAAAVTPGAGVVSFLDGTTLLGTATLNASGLAIYSTSTLALGAHSITASYAGNDAYGPSTSNTVVVVVTQPSSQALLTAVPNPLVVSAPATVGTATLQWSAPAATTVELHVTSPDGPLLAGGGSSGSASTGIWVSDGMLFYLQDTTGGKPLSATNTLAAAAVAVRQQSSSFFAAPNPIPNTAGSALGETTIQWDVPTATNVEVHVGATDGPLLAAWGPAGSAATGLWVTDGMLFFLQDASSGNQLSPAATLATLNVYLQSQPNSLLATPNPVVPSSGTALGATTIQWNAPNATSVEVHVSAPNGTLFAAGGSSGTAPTGQWVSDGTTFYLQDTTGGKPLTGANTLAVVLVHVQPGP